MACSVVPEPVVAPSPNDPGILAAARALPPLFRTKLGQRSYFQYLLGVRGALTWLDQQPLVHLDEIAAIGRFLIARLGHGRKLLPRPLSLLGLVRDRPKFPAVGLDNRPQRQEPAHSNQHAQGHNRDGRPFQYSPKYCANGSHGWSRRLTQLQSLQKGQQLLLFLVRQIGAVDVSAIAVAGASCVVERAETLGDRTRLTDVAAIYRIAQVIAAVESLRSLRRPR